MGVVGKLWKLADRTAVLAVGLIAGFAIGLSFNAGGRDWIGGWLQPGAVSRPPMHPVLAGRVKEPRPDLAGPIAPDVVRRVAADGRVRVGVFGDSFGNGLWDALYRQLPAAERYDVLHFSKEATGFTRYHSLNLEDEARRQLAQQPVDVAVICFGANDLQPIYEERGLQPLLSDTWKRIIGERIDRFVAVARSTGATVFWVGLPVMRDADTDDKIQAMNAYYAERMRALKVPFIDTRPASLDGEGRYNAHLANAATGRLDLVRTPDGMHMTGMGYQRITAGLVAQVRTYAASARRQAGLPAPAPTAQAAEAPHRQPSPSPEASPTPAAKRALPLSPAAMAEREARQTARANRREEDRVRQMVTDDRPANASDPREPGK